MGPLSLPGDTRRHGLSTNPKWQQQWYADGGGAFGRSHPVGLSMIAHLYNQDAARHADKLEAIYNYKQKS